MDARPLPILVLDKLRLAVRLRLVVVHMALNGLIGILLLLLLLLLLPLSLLLDVAARSMISDASFEADFDAGFASARFLVLVSVEFLATGLAAGLASRATTLYR